MIAQLNMPDPVHPDDFSFSIGGMVDNPIEYTLEEIPKVAGAHSTCSDRMCGK